LQYTSVIDMSKVSEQEGVVEHCADVVQQKEQVGVENDDLDPHDPLTWSAARKVTILTVIGLWVFIGTFNTIIIGPALQIVPVELNSSFSSSTYLIGGPLLAYGVASFFWVPLANRLGSRLIFVSTAIAAACMSIWGAKATTFGSLVAARTLASGFFASPETLAPQMIGDVFYIKDRAKAITWINVLQATGYGAGPLFGSFIIQNA
jgi:MFS family permease